MDNYLSALSSSCAPNYSEDCKDGLKVKPKITAMQDTLLFETLVLLIIVLIALVTYQHQARKSAAKAAAFKVTLKNAVSQVVTVTQGRAAVTKCSPGRIKNIRMSNVTTFV